MSPVNLTEYGSCLQCKDKVEPYQNYLITNGGNIMHYYCWLKSAKKLHGSGTCPYCWTFITEEQESVVTENGQRYHAVCITKMVGNQGVGAHVCGWCLLPVKDNNWSAVHTPEGPVYHAVCAKEKGITLKEKAPEKKVPATEKKSSIANPSIMQLLGVGAGIGVGYKGTEALMDHSRTSTLRAALADRKKQLAQALMSEQQAAMGSV